MWQWKPQNVHGLFTGRISWSHHRYSNDFGIEELLAKSRITRELVKCDSFWHSAKHVLSIQRNFFINLCLTQEVCEFSISNEDDQGQVFGT